MTAHTPTPWGFSDAHWSDQRATIHDGKGSCLAILEHDTDDAANAALIVRAVNSHANLVAALNLIGDVAASVNRDPVARLADILDAVHHVRAALAKARE